MRLTIVLNDGQYLQLTVKSASVDIDGRSYVVSPDVLVKASGGLSDASLLPPTDPVTTVSGVFDRPLLDVMPGDADSLGHPFDPAVHENRKTVNGVWKRKRGHQSKSVPKEKPLPPDSDYRARGLNPHQPVDVAGWWYRGNMRGQGHYFPVNPGHSLCKAFVLHQHGIFVCTGSSNPLPCPTCEAELKRRADAGLVPAPVAPPVNVTVAP